MEIEQTRANEGRHFAIGKAVKARRLELAMTQEVLAIKAGVSQSLISGIEQGNYLATKHLVPIADALGLNAHALLASSGESKGRSVERESATPIQAQQDAPTDAELREIWRAAGGCFHGPKVETATMPDAKLQSFLRSLMNAPAQDELDAYLIDRMGKLLAGVAVALKGPEKPRHRHGYQDLPEIAAKVMAELQRVRAEEAEREGDAERYRLVRRGQQWSVIDDIGNTLRAESLDDAIDAVRAQRAAAQGDCDE